MVTQKGNETLPLILEGGKLWSKQNFTLGDSPMDIQLSSLNYENKEGVLGWKHYTLPNLSE